MRANFRLQRLFVEARLGPNVTIDLEKDHSNYLLNVLRLAEGAELLVFNGGDGEWLARLEQPSKKKATLLTREQTRPQPPSPDLVYLFAPLKQARLDYMVQKAVEMGAGVLQPVLTQHTQVHKLNIDRLRANGIEAAEQCGILSIARVEEPLKIDRLLESWDHGRQILFCDEGADGDNPLPILSKLKQGPKAVLIGPEGGFSEDERHMLSALPFVQPIPLGPRILRADTAAVAALALVQATIGDWGGGKDGAPASEFP